jgi:hypothetical protein
MALYGVEDGLHGASRVQEAESDPGLGGGKTDLRGDLHDAAVDEELDVDMGAGEQADEFQDLDEAAGRREIEDASVERPGAVVEQDFSLTLNWGTDVRTLFYIPVGITGTGAKLRRRRYGARLQLKFLHGDCSSLNKRWR